MIIGVAIRTPDDKVIIRLPAPSTHRDCMMYAANELGIDLEKTKLGWDALDQGFYTARGAYLKRREALIYVKRNKQKLIRKPRKYLLAEDLW